MQSGGAEVATVSGSLRTRKSDFHRVLQRLQLKQQAVAALIAGQLGLVEAAVRFRDAFSPQLEDGEALCRSLIGWVHLALSDRPERAEALSEELESELQSHLARHGAVRLPCV